ncbi:hypothetical protein SAMN04487830_12147 [Pseudobutyrivibrio sp. OR37]|uniref:hypothetical protein n=1 Tax=Pseudobutyrivibrio sp. OR37 TaxID=1798186 RepID=UPI0008E64EA3|nr:hypothetical protein [Pseudobutyrivibrio sp. OR37]SFI08576.1 hypothetical protein SAMN04487830_12147 [Pseudobutyrivibrio sp. OR37]
MTNFNLRKELIKKYDELFEKYSLNRPLDSKKIALNVKDILEHFLKDKKKPALYANGGHTRMLMADFMFEMKNVKIIIDNYNQENESGFKQISDDQISEFDIDGIIISSYKFRKEIKEKLTKICPDIPALDIYDEINARGIKLNADYYYGTHPHQLYRTINKLNKNLESEEKLFELVSLYIQIKDFRLAAESVERLLSLFPNETYKLLLGDIKEIREQLLEGYKKIGSKNVLLMCLDGMRRSDVTEDNMPRLMAVINQKGYRYTNAYSFSTSTFESLVPVYSENYDLSTNYYNHGVVDASDCRFIKEALKQGRDIHLYTDMDKHIEGEGINHCGAFQTITEKLWEFVMDALETDNGLFILHELYETHYSFSNPYTSGDVVFEGTAMLFDFLPAKGGKLRADYIRQHNDSLRYVDGIMAEFIELSRFKIFLYADHGNLLLPKNATLKDVSEIQLSCSAEWTEIPFVLIGEYIPNGECDDIVSLSEMNNVVIALEKDEVPIIPKKKYVKCARTQIYNPDFRFLYREMGHEENLMAFEAFVFEDGKKLIVFSNGLKKLYVNEHQIFDDNEINRIYDIVRDQITVLGA